MQILLPYLWLKNNTRITMIPGSKQCDDMVARKNETKPPFRPEPESEKEVRCKHCGETYKEKEIKWDTIRERWVCKNHPHCDGSVVNLDIRHID
jgi:hypothetical protein